MAERVQHAERAGWVQLGNVLHVNCDAQGGEVEHHLGSKAHGRLYGHVVVGQPLLEDHAGVLS